MLVNTLSLVKYCNEIELVDNKVYNFSNKFISVPPISYVMTSFVSKYPCIHNTASYNSLAIRFYFPYMVLSVLLLKSLNGEKKQLCLFFVDCLYFVYSVFLLLHLRWKVLNSNLANHFNIYYCSLSFEQCGFCLFQ